MIGGVTRIMDCLELANEFESDFIRYFIRYDVILIFEKSARKKILSLRFLHLSLLNLHVARWLE